jgi:hypothetical protein
MPMSASSAMCTGAVETGENSTGISRPASWWAEVRILTPGPMPTRAPMLRPPPECMKHCWPIQVSSPMVSWFW